MKAFSLIPAVVLVSACSPLQQAPMIYTSKQVVGVDISAPTTESAGITFSLGYKSIDAAYVPLAVSKDDHGIYSITATYGSDDQNNGAKELGADKTPRVEELKKTIETAEKAEEKANESEEVANAARQYNNLVLFSDSASLDPSITSKLRALNRPRVATSLSDGEPIPDEEIETIEKQRDASKKELAQATPSAEKAREELRNLQSVKRLDAMSVYGSFDSKTGAGAASVDSNLGKVFSTGVAAQNLTEGVAKTNRAVAADRFFANCLKLSEGFEGDEKKAFSQKCADAFFLMMK